MYWTSVYSFVFIVRFWNTTISILKHCYVMTHEVYNIIFLTDDCHVRSFHDNGKIRSFHGHFALVITFAHPRHREQCDIGG